MGPLKGTYLSTLVRGREENKLFFKIEVCSKYFVQDCRLIDVNKYVSPASLSVGCEHSFAGREKPRADKSL